MDRGPGIERGTRSVGAVCGQSGFGEEFRRLAHRTKQATSLVFLHRRIDLIRPGENAAGKVAHLLKAVGLEQLRGPLAAGTRAAVNDDLLVLVELPKAVGKVVLRNKQTADLCDLILVRLAHVE